MIHPDLKAGGIVKAFARIYVVLRFVGLIAALYTGITLINGLVPPLSENVPGWVAWLIRAEQAPASLLDLWMPADPVWNALILFGVSALVSLVVTFVMTRGGGLFLRDFLLRSGAYFAIGVVLAASLAGLVLIANLGWPLWLYVPVLLLGWLMFALVGAFVDAVTEVLAEEPLLGAQGNPGNNNP